MVISDPARVDRSRCATSHIAVAPGGQYEMYFLCVFLLLGASCHQMSWVVVRVVTLMWATRFPLRRGPLLADKGAERPADMQVALFTPHSVVEPTRELEHSSCDMKRIGSNRATAHVPCPATPTVGKLDLRPRDQLQLKCHLQQKQAF
jgi:hypothetical protein